ncbi:YugN-like family protein [Lederbergia citri]|uniref:YugN-like family protein n=1 Tax=Lederbergia citri TaxID=2833580 RepID=A0A942TEY2_9BACI|nr:YugN-like family protein [Lederbergia citri]MBS4195189.1 YugN-like family protein [Lederbergia citri]
MFEINSTIEGKEFNLHKLEQLLKPKGYVIGGNWEYDRGFFDYKMADDGGYQFLRVPFTAVWGELDTPGVVVKLGTPFVLSHVYQKGLDDHADSSNMSASFNQFSEPEDSDGSLDEKYIQMGKDLVNELETIVSY